MKDALIEARGVSYDYPGGGTALRGVGFHLEAGERVVLLGANATGKSTLLKILDGLLFPRQGVYRFRGNPVTEEALAEIAYARFFRREVAYLFQVPDAMLFNPTVFDEIAFGPRQLGLDSIDDRVRQWAQRVGLGRDLDRQPLQLSGGEKQKLCLAALLVLEPSVLLLDEPTAHLDPRSTGWLVGFLRELEATTMISTHNLSLAAELGDRTLILSEEHEIVFDGPLADAMGDRDLLIRANLVHAHLHRHRDIVHEHYHIHDWD